MINSFRPFWGLLFPPTVPVLVAAVYLAGAGSPAAAWGQAVESPSPAVVEKGEGAAADEAALISLNFPENMPLKVLVDYVAERLKVNLLYDPQLISKRVTIKAATKVTEDSLLGLLESVLKMNDLALVDADQPGWKRIVAAQNLVNISRTDQAPAGEFNPTAALTQVIKINHADVNRVDQVVRPFLSPRGANSFVVGERNLLIVTDYADNMKRVVDLVALMDQPTPGVVVEFVPARQMEASALAQQAGQLLGAKQKSKGAGVAQQVEIRSDARTNQLVLIGQRADVDEALTIINALDVKLDLETRIYKLQAAAPEKVDRLVRELIGPVAARTQYSAAIDREAGFLIVTGSKEVHDHVARISRDLDVAPSETQSRVRFYKLANRTAAEVLATIRAIEGSSGLAGLNLTGEPSARSVGTNERADGSKSEGAVDGGASPGNPAGTPGGPGTVGVVPAPGLTSPLPGIESVAPAYYTQGAVGEGGAIPSAARQTVQTSQARITADTDTNTIIVIADPSVQPTYERLITLLDKRRPQVLLEVMLVTLDTSGGFSLGVELSRETTDVNGGRVVTFSSYGLSDVTANTGQLALKPGLGFNGALVDADIGEVVIRALKTSGRAKVVSAPRILVNDNATGTLASINEAPFSSVNASNTVATTSFAGYASAGTTISITPHISEGDHLQLDYQVTLNSFTGQGSDSSPPPRQTNTVSSQVTIPDGSWIVVGGLNRQDTSKSVTGIPLIDDIPILKHLARNETQNTSDSTLFVFMRPLILRDDQFEDLKYLSAKDLEPYGLADKLPVSEPMLMR